MLDFLSILFFSFPKEQSSELDAPVIHRVDLAQGAQLLRRVERRGRFFHKGQKIVYHMQDILPVTIDFTPIIAYFAARGNSAL